MDVVNAVFIPFSYVAAFLRVVGDALVRLEFISIYIRAKFESLRLPMQYVVLLVLAYN